ncbi:uncharacterized protein ACR2FA_001264 [Aphomia sociella]
MNNAPQFSLRWNNYVNHVTEAFNELRFENDLVDVTLCCDGGKIKAHKMLLSACSSYFKQIFKENPCQHPVIIFRNFKYEDLNAIINFMYHGEVNIFQEQLESFLITAELLEVKGLTDNADDDSPKRDSFREVRLSDNISLDLSSKSTRFTEDIVPVLLDEPINLATIQNERTRDENIPQINVLPNLQEQESENSESHQVFLKSDDNLNMRPKTVTPSEEMQIDNQSTSAEDLLEKNTTESDLAKFRCQLCPKGFKHPTSLTLHKDSHAGKTQCPVCHRSFSRSYDMRSHLQRIHQGKQLTIKEIRYKNSNDTIAPKQFTHHI